MPRDVASATPVDVPTIREVEIPAPVDVNVERRTLTEPEVDAVPLPRTRSDALTSWPLVAVVISEEPSDVARFDEVASVAGRGATVTPDAVRDAVRDAKSVADVWSEAPVAFEAMTLTASDADVLGAARVMTQSAAFDVMSRPDMTVRLVVASVLNPYWGTIERVALEAKSKRDDVESEAERDEATLASTMSVAARVAVGVMETESVAARVAAAFLSTVSVAARDEAFARTPKTVRLDATVFVPLDEIPAV